VSRLITTLLAALAIVALPASGLEPAPAAGTAADYRIGAGDLLHAGVAGYADMTADLRVSESGSITFPYIGQVPVAGLSTAEAEVQIAQRLVTGAIVRQPQVSVLVADYQSQPVAVMGQVNAPGQYPLKASRKVVDLLAQAGGPINETAGDQATLLRKDGSKVTLDLRLLFEGDPQQNLPVAGGDIIFVPRAPVFYVTGQVQRPGSYKLQRDMTVAQAISAGGGLTLRGSDRRVVAKRRDAGGKQREVPVRSADVVLSDDVLTVKESLF
jgi:polysaccharide export outer membrane protein